MRDRGAHFFRCDLQVHSPRDQRWVGSDCPTDEERLGYAGRLIQACRERDLNGIAITDHHDMGFVEYVRRAAAAETDLAGGPLPCEQRLVVFPGIELTLGVPCQALLLFDADFPADLFTLALSSLAINPSPADAHKIANVERLVHIDSFVKLKSELDKHAYLQNRYIVFPNVTNNGKSSLLRTGLYGKYIDMPCVGGFVDGSVDNLSAGNVQILSGKDKSWGNKRVACFQTSDNRREDHQDLGRVSTWIKWARPTAEALRQACLAQESRIFQIAPRLPSSVIVSISVTNSRFMGPIDLTFNPQYTCLIGGRGTGKSTILEYLRWVLCDQPPDVADDDAPKYQARRGRLIDLTLKPFMATVEVRFDVNEVSHIVRRDSQDGSLLLKIGYSPMRPCSEDEIRSLLPIQAYSQKQLSDVSVRIDELLRFLDSPVTSALNRINRQLASHVDRIRQLYTALRRQRALALTLQNHVLEHNSLTEQVDKLRSSLTGLSDADRTIIEQGKHFDAANNTISAWKAGVKSIRDDVEHLRDLTNSLKREHISPLLAVEQEITNAVYQEYTSFLNEATQYLTNIIGYALIIDDMIKPSNPWSAWDAKYKAFKDKYSEAISRSSAHKQKLEELRAVEDQLRKQDDEKAHIEQELRGLTEVQAQYAAEYSEWLGLLKERDSLLESQCRKLTDSSGGVIRARLEPSGTSDFLNVLRQSLTGSRVPGTKVDAVGVAITEAANPTAKWRELLEDLEKLAESEPERDGSDRRPATAALSAAGLSNSDLDRIARVLKPEHWLALSVTPIGVVPIFEYRAREEDYIPFKNASAGQQATALLKTLLNQAGPPLIIDQPEEDLDNPVMLEIVEQIWDAKQKRQLIFVSHNANLVVNGDAELVAWCDYRAASDQSRGTIAGEGAIDVPEVREAIKKIMEGGEAAFNLRREKYGF